MEFTLYFKDADEVSAAQRRIETRFNPIETLSDVRTDLVTWLEERGTPTDPIGTARAYQTKLRDIAIEVVWPAASNGPSDWELIVKAASIENVQAVVGVDLDYTWEQS